MIYVGVPNSPMKTRLVNRTPRLSIHVDPEHLAWDCGRHIAFLREVARRRPDGYGAWMATTEYAGYLLQTGRSVWSVHQRCGRFASQYARIRASGWPGPWAIVTSDGLRLDGSHRAAIARVLQISRVPVSVVQYFPGDEEWQQRMLEIREQKLRGVFHVE